MSRRRMARAGIRADADPTDARLAALEDRVTRLEARFRPGDAADVQALTAIGTAIGGRPFTSRQLLTYARTADPALAAALEGADVGNVYELGKLLSRLTARLVEGLAVERVDEVKAGTRWRIVVRS